MQTRRAVFWRYLCQSKRSSHTEAPAPFLLSFEGISQVSSPAAPPLTCTQKVHADLRKSSLIVLKTLRLFCYADLTALFAIFLNGILIEGKLVVIQITRYCTTELNSPCFWRMHDGRKCLADFSSSQHTYRVEVIIKKDPIIKSSI